MNAIKEAFHENIVLLFRKQNLTPAQHVDFTSFFGPVEAHPLGSREGAQAQPEILVLENRADTPAPRNDFWHSDISFAECPPLGSVLHALEVPGEGLGDTLFCNMYKVFEELSQGLQNTLEGLRALHSAEALVMRNNADDNNAKPISAIPDLVSHPVVRTHPETGRKALYVNPYFTESFEGWTPAESRLLLDWLNQLATRQENIYRHRWRKGDVLMWDNRCAMHYAVYDYGSKPRLFHRATAAGDRPV
jgi:taurine dioxygenase